MTRLRTAAMALLALALAGCGTTTAYTPPGLDYPPGAFTTRDGKPKVLPCIAGGLLCSPQEIGKS